MKKIYLYYGRGVNKKLTDKFALVDEEDFESLNQFQWGYMKLYHCDSPIIYARRFENKKIILMHRAVLKVEDSKIKIDHEDHDGLNCQKINLRESTHSQNMSNRKKKADCASKFLGVYRYGKDRWIAETKHNGIRHKSKPCSTEIEAALGYNDMVKNLKGDFCKLNIIENG